MTKRNKKDINEDECLAGYWLLSQGHKVSINFDDPPDFEVDRKIAVEVTRISQHYTDNPNKKDTEESIRSPLFNTVKKILEELDQDATGPLWEVRVEVYFPSAVVKLAPDNKKAERKQIREALAPYTRPESDPAHPNHRMLHQRNQVDFDRHHDEMDLLSNHHVCLPCGFCLDLLKIHSEERSGFILGDVSHTEGAGVLCELIKSVKYAIEDKTGKIPVKDDFAEWWLVLVDHISPVPHSGLSSNEMTELRNVIDMPDPWSRIIVISSKNIQWHYDLHHITQPANLR